jgi:hypothetical protein
MNEPIALFDMDGTLCDYDGAMWRDLKRLQSPWDVYPDHIYNDAHPPWFKARCDMIRKVPGWWFNLAPLNMGFSVFNETIQLGYKINILTKGPSSTPSAWQEKVQWCQHHLPSEVAINIVTDKSLVYGKVLVDDYPPYIESWLKFRPRGLVIMVANKGNERFAHPQVIRYDGTNFNLVKEALNVIYKQSA